MLKDNPEMVKLIQNIPSANDGGQYKDSNNITKYLELNKDRILNLAEKNYENLVEALANDSISSAVASLSNPASSLPQSSSSTFNLGPYNQPDTYRIEESEYFSSEQRRYC